MRNTIYYEDGSSEILEERKLLEGIYVFALHDFQTKYYFRTDWGYSVPRSLYEDKDKLINTEGYPEMVPLKPRMGVELTRRLQWFWVRQLVLSMYGISIYEHDGLSVEEDFQRKLDLTRQSFIIEAWRRITKGHTAFTNGRGTDTCIDYIGKNNTSSTSLPILWENTCGGHTLLVNSKTITDTMEWIEVKTLKASEYDKWKMADFRLPQWRPFFTFGTNSVPFRSGTRNTFAKTPPWKVDPMHFLNGNNVPVPLISATGYVYVHRSRIRILGSIDQFPEAYVL